VSVAFVIASQGCASNPRPIAHSDTCRAVRAVHAWINEEHEDTKADDQRRLHLEKQVGVVASEERPSTYMVRLARTFSHAASEVWANVDKPMTDEEREPALDAYGNTLIGLYAACELPPGVNLR
jgi:hypothetical protein